VSFVFASNSFLAYSCLSFLALKDMDIVGRKTLHLLRLLTFFIAILLQRGTVAESSSIQNYTKYRQISSLRLERINKHLDKINKPPVLTIEVMLFIAINVSYNVFIVVEILMTMHTK